MYTASEFKFERGSSTELETDVSLVFVCRKT
jgi:hypothetical protein